MFNEKAAGRLAAFLSRAPPAFDRHEPASPLKGASAHAGMTVRLGGTPSGE
jgi:hypothetical protein